MPRAMTEESRPFGVETLRRKAAQGDIHPRPSVSKSCGAFASPFATAQTAI